MKYLNHEYNELEKYALENKVDYISAKPFPHIVIDNFFNNNLLNDIINEFPKNLDKIGNKFENKVERKLSLNKSHLLSDNTNNFLNFLNSQIFLNFLQKLTGIDEKLVPDPYLLGGGLHELRKDGYLNIHADFNLHPSMKLDRRLNILIYLNKNWKENFGGSLQLWDKNMKECIQKIIPEFNRMVIFSTTDFSYHGNPDKVSCAEDNSRKSIAMYYYSNGRPSYERKLGLHSTIFRKRPDTHEPDGNIEFKKIFGQFYIRKKKKID
jgi:Rps23 Pro-64 3,4-dihydroxylase Tpa1-like proline 4-hydroxylase